MLIPHPENVVAAIYQLDIDPDSMCRIQLADEQLAPVIKALEEGKTLPVSSSSGIRITFIQNGLLYRKFQFPSSSHGQNITLM